MIGDFAFITSRGKKLGVYALKEGYKALGGYKNINSCQFRKHRSFLED
jgi:hypothetical protein